MIEKAALDLGLGVAFFMFLGGLSNGDKFPEITKNKKSSLRINSQTAFLHIQYKNIIFEPQFSAGKYYLHDAILQSKYLRLHYLNQ